jgi:hypothetical protein
MCVVSQMRRFSDVLEIPHALSFNNISHKVLQPFYLSIHLPPPPNFHTQIYTSNSLHLDLDLLLVNMSAPPQVNAKPPNHGHARCDKHVSNGMPRMLSSTGRLWRCVSGEARCLVGYSAGGTGELPTWAGHGAAEIRETLGKSSSIARNSALRTCSSFCCILNNCIFLVYSCHCRLNTESSCIVIVSS